MKLNYILYIEGISLKIVSFNEINVFFRSGPILQLNWTEFDTIEQTNRELSSINHKTGKFYTVHIFIREDQRRFLKAMKAKYIEEFGVTPHYVFSSSVNKVESSICRSIQEVFKETFNDDPAVVRFNANSIRKFWEQMWAVIKGQVSEGVTKAHLAQTAHSEKTAQEKYLAKNGTRDDRVALLNIYADRLSEEQPDELDLPEANSPPEDEFVESDFEDQASSLAPSSTSSPARPTPVTRFNLIRDSVQPPTPTPTPVSSQTQAPTTKAPAKLPTTSNVPAPSSSRRDSLDMTTRDPTPGEKYFKSLTNFRVKANAPIWTDDEKKACLLFRDCRGTVAEGEVRRRIQEGGYDLTDAQCSRIYAKIKTATQVFRK